MGHPSQIEGVVSHQGLDDRSLSLSLSPNLEFQDTPMGCHKRRRNKHMGENIAKVSGIF